MSFTNRIKAMFSKKSSQPSSSDGSELNFDTYTERGSEFLQDGNFEAALQEFDKAVNLASNVAEEASAYLNRGRVFNRLHNSTAALQDLNRVAEMSPPPWEATADL